MKLDVKELIEKLLNGRKWEYLTGDTISSPTQRLDISNYVNDYEELVFLCRQNTSSRHTAPIVVPTIILKKMGNGLSYFETGAYFTVSAHIGIRLIVEKTNGTSYGIGVDWCYYEDTLYNSVVGVYGRK